MEFRTLVELPRKELQISHSQRIVLLGSCFAENIGTKLTENKFQCETNPFGVLYNPFSIAQALKEIQEGKVYTKQDLFFEKEQWHSYMHHSSFSDVSFEKCLRNINDRLQQAKEQLRVAEYVLITFGTAYIYKIKENGKIAGNCHKLPESFFIRRLAKEKEITEEMGTCISSLLLFNPRIKFLFTVSPIRHVKDGMHGNQLSKATLLLSIRRLSERFPGKVYYFPSYELIMDELRDYRFYADDMLHPSSLAIEYVWEKFAECYFSKETAGLIREWEEIKKALTHKPFCPGSEKYNIFLRQNVLKIKRIKEKYPYLDVEKELELCHIRLKK